MSKRFIALAVALTFLGDQELPHLVLFEGNVH